MSDVFGFRFSDTQNEQFCQLFAIGYDRITPDHAYHWDGLTRIDGPLCLFQYTVSGTGILETEGVMHSIQKGQAILIDIPSDHCYYLPQSSDHWAFYFILFRPSVIKPNWDQLAEKLGPAPSLPVDSAPVQLLQHAYQAAKQKQITNGFQASAVVYQFVMALQQYSCTASRTKINWPDPVRQAAAQIEKYYQHLHSLNDIAQVAGLSKFHFTRLFHQATGYTPIEYLTKVRIEQAVSLLLHSSLSIEDIAREIGFSSSSYFIKVFRKWTGFSPGEFRSGRALTSFSHLTFD